MDCRRFSPGWAGSQEECSDFRSLPSGSHGLPSNLGSLLPSWHCLRARRSNGSSLWSSSLLSPFRPFGSGSSELLYIALHACTYHWSRRCVSAPVETFLKWRWPECPGCGVRCLDRVVGVTCDYCLIPDVFCSRSRTVYFSFSILKDYQDVSYQASGFFHDCQCRRFVGDCRCLGVFPSLVALHPHLFLNNCYSLLPVRP